MRSDNGAVLSGCNSIPSMTFTTVSSTAVASPSPADVAFEQLGEAITGLDIAMTTLAVKITPVMRDINAGDTSSYTGTVSDNSQLVNAIRDARDRVERMRVMALELIERIEL